MDRAVILGFAIALGMTRVVGAQTAPKPAGAAPGVITPTTAPTPVPIAPSTSTRAAAAGPVAAAGVAPPRRPLDLRLGDLRRYFTPEELQSPLPDLIADEVLVEGTGGGDATPSGPPIPVGLVAPYWAATHPLSAWRIFLPDPNAVPAPRY